MNSDRAEGRSKNTIILNGNARTKTMFSSGRPSTAGKAKAARGTGNPPRLTNGDPPSVMLWGDEE